MACTLSSLHRMPRPLKKHRMLKLAFQMLRLRLKKIMVLCPPSWLLSRPLTQHLLQPQRMLRVKMINVVDPSLFQRHLKPRTSKRLTQLPRLTLPRLNKLALPEKKRSMTRWVTS